MKQVQCTSWQQLHDTRVYSMYTHTCTHTHLHTHAGASPEVLTQLLQAASRMHIQPPASWLAAYYEVSLPRLPQHTVPQVGRAPPVLPPLSSTAAPKALRGVGGWVRVRVTG